MRTKHLLVALLAFGMLLGFTGAAGAVVTPADDGGADDGIPPCEPVDEDTCCMDVDWDGEYEECYDVS